MQTFCEVCTNRTCEVTGKPCKEIERLLPKKLSGTLKKEFPARDIEEIATKRAFELRYGKHKPKSPVED